MPTKMELAQNATGRFSDMAPLLALNERKLGEFGLEKAVYKNRRTGSLQNRMMLVNAKGEVFDYRLVLMKYESGAKINWAKAVEAGSNWKKKGDWEKTLGSDYQLVGFMNVSKTAPKKIEDEKGVRVKRNKKPGIGGEEDHVDRLRKGLVYSRIDSDHNAQGGEINKRAFEKFEEENRVQAIKNELLEQKRKKAEEQKKQAEAQRQRQEQEKKEQLHQLWLQQQQEVVSKYLAPASELVTQRRQEYMKGLGGRALSPRVAEYIRTEVDGNRRAYRNIVKFFGRLAQSVGAESRVLETVFESCYNFKAKRYDFDPYLAIAIMATESDGKENAVGKNTRWGRAKGRFQLISATAQMQGVDRADPKENIQGGVAELKRLFERYGASITIDKKGMIYYDEKTVAAIAAYNSGQGGGDRFLRQGKLYAETSDYVPVVLDFYKVFRGIGLEGMLYKSVNQFVGEKGQVIASNLDWYRKRYRVT
ncbi:hypothetical protein FJZ26_01785 [Candidatus Parvarchaeota archaeon]|nr:hypothetical protein [Candidatus Parvarchaeota archaeon]